MRKRKKWLSALLAATMTAQTVAGAFPVEVKAARTDIVFHDFEGENLTSNDSGTLTTEEVYSGEQALKYDSETYSQWNVEVEAKDQTVDISQQEYITFWIKDAGSNNLAVKIIDKDGNGTEVWTPDDAKSVAGEWTLMSIPLSDFDFTSVDKTNIAKVAFWEWNDGVYYIDDIKFVKALPTDSISVADFEGDAPVIEGTGSVTTEQKHTGEQSLMLEYAESDSNTYVTIQAGSEIDALGQKYLTFWLLDNNGSNNPRIKLIDADGNESAEKWTDTKCVQGEWTYISVPLTEFTGVDLEAITKIAVYEWNAGTYYIDDINFVATLPADEEQPMNGTAAWLQNFEGDALDGTYEAADAGVTVSVKEAVGCEKDGIASTGLVYEKSDSSSPEVTDGSVVIKSDTPVDTTGLRYLIFYIKDTQGSNTLKVSLIDKDGKETDFGSAGWCETKTTKGDWKQYSVALDSRTGNIDWTQVTGVRIGEWNQGTYYIDNVYFDNYLYTQTPDSGILLPEVEEGKVAATVSAGKYTTAQTVELVADSDAFIYYTTDGTTPTRSSEYLYKGAIDVSGSTTIQAVAAKDDTVGEVCTFVYDIVPYPVTATSEPGTYTDSAVVEFRTKNDKDLIYYTTDGTDPVRNEGTTKQFIKPMLVTETTTFKAIAYDRYTGAVNDVEELSYVIEKSGKTVAPVFSKPAGTYGASVVTTLTAEEGSSIYYTTDGSEPTAQSKEYAGEITIDQNMTIKAVAIKNDTASEVVTAEYTLDCVETPFLKADGKVLKDNYGTGDTITLRGSNAGGWLVTEDWQCPTNAKDQLTAQTVFTERFGAETAQELITLYQDNWWTEADFDLVKQEGMNMLRLPVTHFEMLNEDGTLKETAFDRMEWFIENCEKRGIYVLIDMHGAVGSQNGKDHSGDITIPDVGDFYGNEENITKTIKLWEEIVKRYKDNPWVCGYDLLNEPSAVGTTQFEVYDRIYDAIRAIDKNHVIYIQAIWEPTHLPDPAFYGWENVAYQYHFYGWDVEKDSEGQKDFIESKVQMVNEDTNYNVPLLVGEFTFFSNLDSWKAMDIFEEQGWSYTSWTWKVTGNNSSWGMYTSDHEKVDIYKDSEETIREKWAADKLNTDSAAFTRNDDIADILKTYFANNESNKPGTTSAEGISVADTIHVELGKTAELNAKVVPENTAYQALSYETDNESVIAVDAKGVVTAKAEGTAVVTVKNLYGMSKTCTVTVAKKAENNPSNNPSGTENGGTNLNPGKDTTEVVAPAKVTGLKQTKSAAKSLKVSWQVVDKADGYEVTFVNGKKKTTKETTATNMSFSKLSAGKVYTVEVRAFTNKGSEKLYGEKATFQATTLLSKKPASFKVKKTGKKAKLTWKKVSGVTGYEVYMKTGKGSYKKVKSLKGASKVSYTKSSLKKGKTYTFKIRAYKKVNGTKVYSKYTSAKTVKIK